MKVIGYIRVSTQGQARDGYSLAYQEDEIKAYCQAHGYTLLRLFKDEGISGAKVDEEALEVDRMDFQEMLEYLAHHEVDYVVTLNTSRLWRSDIVKVLVYRELKKYGVDIRSLEQPQYSIHKKDPSDFLINGLMELLDQYQRLEISLKLGRGRNKKAQQGGYAGGNVALGYKVEKSKKRLVIDDRQAKTVQRVFDLKEQYPSWTLTQLAERLNEEGHRTKQGKLFTKVQVKRILDRKAFYSGLYHYEEITANGKHQAIL
ncbi:recombinase family protein [Ornithinibacillus massiliensis]|uniref:Recombinase family protein n=1 Tax=Ornithinibacillus massiliensis TaxID=1944633 RepID=A0ABS5MIX6_9BACI|nr:recombinase family protein [Ornithinibacillus massiliensis]MBS3682287.1 recombinase family protein [Ornithinibacillus massiliensis]